MSTDFLSIDENALDEAWLQQASLMHQYSVKLANARLELDDAKNALELARAKVAKKVRRNPKAFGCDGRLTESFVTDAVLLNSEFIEAQERVGEAKHTVDIVNAAVTALDHKRKALESLVYLHGQNYFAEPRVKGVGREVAGRIVEDSVKRKIRGKMPRTGTK